MGIINEFENQICNQETLWTKKKTMKSNFLLQMIQGEEEHKWS